LDIAAIGLFHAYPVNAQIFRKKRYNILKIMNFRRHKPQTNIDDKISIITISWNI